MNHTSFAVQAIGGVLALFLAAATISASVRLARHLRTDDRQKGKDEAAWLTPLLCACGAVAALTGLGVIPVLSGAVSAVILAATAGFILLRGAGWQDVLSLRLWRSVARTLRSHAGGSVRYLREDLRWLVTRLQRGEQPAPASPAPVRPAAAAPGPRTVPAPRPVPSVRDDPALGPAPAAAEVASGLAGAGVAVPQSWGVLCESVGTFEPDTDEDEIGFVAAQAAGILAYSDAWRAKADTLLHNVGLDPAYVAGTLEFADVVADNAGDLAMVVQRFHVIYDALRDWVDEHPDGMPHEARKFLQGGNPPADSAGSGDDIAA